MINIELDTQETGERQVLLNIDDDGIGFDPEELHYNRLGLINMRERAEALGGTFQVMSNYGSGVSTFVKIPLKEEYGDSA